MLDSEAYGVGVFSGSLTWQERISTLNRKGEERTFREDMLSLDVNDQI